MSKPPANLLDELERAREAWRMVSLEADRWRGRFLVAVALAFGFLCSTILGIVLLVRGLP